MAKGHRSQIKASMSFCHFKVPPFVIFNIQVNTWVARTASCDQAAW